MAKKIQWILLLTGLLFLAGCCCGCGEKKEEAVSEFFQQVEIRQELADFSALLQEAERNEGLSGIARRQHVYLAMMILQKYIVQYRADWNTAGLNEVEKLLKTDIAERQLDTEFFQKQVDEALRFIRFMRIQQQYDAQYQTLLRLQSALHRSKLQNEDSGEDAFAELARLYPAIAFETLKTFFASYVAYGRLLQNPAELERRPDLNDLLEKNFVLKCSRCQASGKDVCDICRGSGICRICKGSGKKAMYKHIQFSSGVGWSYQQGWRNARQRERLDVKNWTACPEKCADCQGLGYRAQSCTACHGEKYFLNQERLEKVLQEQYLFADTLLTELLASVMPKKATL